MNNFQQFDLERIMNKWENRVDFNLTESGVHPITLRELLGERALADEFLDTRLGYPECNGATELRNHVAAMYPGARADHVLATVGCAEANFIATQTLLGQGDEIVVMVPNYLQIWGLAHNLGLRRKAFHLNESLGWGVDMAELQEVVSPKTKLIAVCNPNNPTGHILTGPEMKAIIAVADQVGAWILSDETYRGAERLTDAMTETFWGKYDKVVVTASLSKSYGLPGLRMGWLVAPPETVEQAWWRHDYTAISTTMLANKLASLALGSQSRARLLRRGREFIRNGYPVLDDWVNKQGKVLSVVPPQAAAIAFVRYALNINSTAFAERLIQEKSVFVVPGDCFGIDHHVRISFGLPRDYLEAGLSRMGEFIAELL